MHRPTWNDRALTAITLLSALTLLVERVSDLLNHLRR